MKKNKSKNYKQITKNVDTTLKSNFIEFIWKILLVWKSGNFETWQKKLNFLFQIVEEDDQIEPSDAGAVPPPKQLTLERQLNKSILIGE